MSQSSFFNRYRRETEAWEDVEESETPECYFDCDEDNGDAEGSNFDSLLVFGDSLSEVGNVFIRTQGTIPPSPPYFEGRFSNGEVLVERLGEVLELDASTPGLAGGTNFAFGGARTGFGLSDRLTPNVGEQINLYLSENSPDETDLVFLYAGGNNFLQSPTPLDPAIVVEDIAIHIGTLAAAGAETFIVPNSGDVGATPFVRSIGRTEEITESIDNFNALLDIRLDELEETLNVEIIEVDIAEIFGEILDDPLSFGFVNSTDPALNQETLELVENPNRYVFWDNVHPTEAVTDILLEEVLDDLGELVSVDGEGESPDNWNDEGEGEGERDSLTGESIVADEEVPVFAEMEDIIEIFNTTPPIPSVSSPETIEVSLVTDFIAEVSETSFEEIFSL